VLKRFADDQAELMKPSQMLSLKVAPQVVLASQPIIDIEVCGIPLELTTCQLETHVLRVERIRSAVAAFRIGPADQLKEGVAKLRLEMMRPAVPGIHVVHIRVLSPTGEEIVPPAAVLGAPAYIRVSDHLAVAPVAAREIDKALRTRERAITSELRPSPDTHGDQYEVYVFWAATLIHGEHHFEGFSVFPLQMALSEEGYRDAMNAFTQPRLGLTVPHSEELSAQYRHSTPAFVIAYHRVRAASHDDALSFAQKHAEAINVVLGVERGQKASVFGILSRKKSGAGVGDTRWGYNYPSYRGNLLAPMIAGQLEESIERLLPKIQKSPWARLLVSNYAVATAERDHGFQYLRYWSLLETIAKKNVVHDGIAIYDVNGLPITNRGKPIVTRGARAKVYHYLTLSNVMVGHETTADGTSFVFEGSAPAHVTDGAQVITLWDDLGAMYHIRNAVTHTGEYSPDLSAAPDTDAGRAARFFPNGSLFGRLREHARAAMYRELALS